VLLPGVRLRHLQPVLVFQRRRGLEGDSGSWLRPRLSGSWLQLRLWRCCRRCLLLGGKGRLWGSCGRRVKNCNRRRRTRQPFVVLCRPLLLLPGGGRPSSSPASILIMVCKGACAG
jgi:hypothetical protein